MSDHTPGLPQCPTEPRRAADPAEPATMRALWPTFLRRTLEEEALRADAAPRSGFGRRDGGASRR